MKLNATTIFMSKSTQVPRCPCFPIEARSSLVNDFVNTIELRGCLT